ncbi:hypothetical protein B0H14DRAFT_3730623 [Mycena olivaceomarginata]|nr:hypothetical protein B0H14DRAFT_3730623 [Mycena olivaceomarginata]
MPKGKKKNQAVNAPRFDITSTLECNKCRQKILVGTGGFSNLESHKNSKDCVEPQGRKISDMFKRAPPTTYVPSTVTAAAMVHGPAASTSATLSSSQTDAHVTSAEHLPIDGHVVEHAPIDGHVIGETVIDGHVVSETPCPDLPPQTVSAEQVIFPSKWDALHHLRSKITQIPMIPTILPESSILWEFSGNPADFFGLSEPVDRDKVLNDLLDRMFGHNSWFFEYFVREHGYDLRNIVDVILFLEEGIDIEFPANDLIGPDNQPEPPEHNLDLRFTDDPIASKTSRQSGGMIGYKGFTEREYIPEIGVRQFRSGIVERIDRMLASDGEDLNTPWDRAATTPPPSPQQPKTRVSESVRDKGADIENPTEEGDTSEAEVSREDGTTNGDTTVTSEVGRATPDSEDENFPSVLLPNRQRRKTIQCIQSDTEESSDELEYFLDPPYVCPTAAGTQIDEIPSTDPSQGSITTADDAAHEPTPSSPACNALTLLNVGGCDGCGKLITEAEKGDKLKVIECSKKGCETRWFHRACTDGLEGDVPKNWACDLCRAPKRRRG